MPSDKSAELVAALRRLSLVRHRRPARLAEAVPLLVRLISSAGVAGVEERATGLAFRLRCGGDSLTCLLHREPAVPLTAAERAVVDLLAEGRTLAQIARLRGVTVNTIKSQVRQLFRKHNVESRVALVRKLCP